MTDTAASGPETPDEAEAHDKAPVTSAADAIFVLGAFAFALVAAQLSLWSDEGPVLAAAALTVGAASIALSCSGALDTTSKWHRHIYLFQIAAVLLAWIRAA